MKYLIIQQQNKPKIQLEVIQNKFTILKLEYTCFFQINKRFCLDGFSLKHLRCMSFELELDNLSTSQISACINLQK